MCAFHSSTTKSMRCRSVVVTNHVIINKNPSSLAILVSFVVYLYSFFTSAFSSTSSLLVTMMTMRRTAGQIISQMCDGNFSHAFDTTNLHRSSSRRSRRWTTTQIFACGCRGEAVTIVIKVFVVHVVSVVAAAAVGWCCYCCFCRRRCCCFCYFCILMYHLSL